MLFYEICDTFKNNYLEKHLRTAASENGVGEATSVSHF